MNKIKYWIKAFRLRTLPLSLSCIIMGSSISYFEESFKLNIFLLTIITTILLQILSNLANDYGDAIKGTDNDQRVGPERALQSGIITQIEMKRAIAINAILAFTTGLILIYTAFNDYSLHTILIFIFIGIASIIAAIKYTMGKNPYGYSGMGDLFVFLFFGLVGVIGTYYLYTKTLNLALILPAFTIGLLSSAVLNMNNMRDVENDRACNKNTLVVKIGFNKAKYYHAFLIIGALISLILTIITFKLPSISFISLIPFILLIKNIRTTWKTTINSELDPELKKIALSTFFISLLIAISTIA